ncbi:hypothetical protein [Nocardia alba]|uniref:hypothetical protein n=1 Tax=Nocardia alba TaxID=225051 RepID=UPI00083789EB|nr:hypothetical protein [Nocardia alba]
MAELLARNAAQGAAPAASGGGGRRRRSGRGLSVTDLTGENAAVKPNSHAAPAPPAPQPPPAYVPPPTYAPEPTPTYEPPASYQPAPYPPPGPAEPAFSPMSGPIARFDPDAGYSAPATRDPLGLGEQRPSTDPFGPFRAEARDAGSRGGARGPGRLGVPGGPTQPVDPGIAEMFGSGALPAVGGGRRHRPEEPEVAPRAEPPKPPPVVGGRAARRRAAEAAEEANEAAAAPVRPSFDAPLYEAGIDAPQAFMGRPGQSRGLDAFPDIGSGFDNQAGSAFDSRPAPGFNGRPGESFDGRPASGFNGPPGESFDGQPATGRPGVEPARGFNGAGRNGAPVPNGQPGRGDAAQAFNGYPPPSEEATQVYKLAPGVDAPPARGADQRPSLDRRRGEPKSGGLPSWSARRHRPEKNTPAPESGGFPTAAWSPVSQEQPLLSGQSVAGDLLRQRAQRGPDADARTELVHRVGADQVDNEDTDDYAESDYVDRDYTDNDYSDADYAESDYDDAAFDDDDYDDDYEPNSTRAGRRAATKAAALSLADRARAKVAARTKSKPASVAESRAASRLAGNRAAGSVADRAGRVASMARGDGDNANRRQWLILGAQSAGAAVAGMLLFKGFETMWETLPWVALALAMVVILGLVALVRVLRRTDDIFSTVIAVVVGVFVTLGPLAFLLSTS